MCAYVSLLNPEQKKKDNTKKQTIHKIQNKIQFILCALANEIIKSDIFFQLAMLGYEDMPSVFILLKTF